MEIKAELSKPYTEKERLEFIVEQNHNNGYEIKETDCTLEAWGYVEEELEEQEHERIDNLTMTPLDFIKFLQSAGLTIEQTSAYLESNLEAKMQLTYCNNVYCKIAKSFMPVVIGDITITAKDVEDAFIAKYEISNQSA